MKKKIIMIAVLAAAAVLGYVGYTRMNGSSAQSNKIFGNVELREVLLSFRVDGRVEELMFEEGQQVRAGEIAARLDDVQYRSALREAEAELAAAEAALSKLHAGYEDDDIKAARAERSRVAASLRNARTNYARFKDLYDQGVIAQKELDDVATARDQLAAALAGADSTIHKLTSGFRTEDIEAAEAQVKAVEAKVELAHTALADTSITVPTDGTIMTRITEPGTMVAAGMPVYAMLQASPIQVRAYVNERQLGKIKLGMQGKIYVDSHPDDPIIGTISFISPEAEFTPKQVQTEDIRATLVYRVRLIVSEDRDGRLKNGMPATVVIDELTDDR